MSYNKVIMIGNLTRDPQLSYTPSQTAVVDFGIAVNRRWKSSGGTQMEKTCFVECKAFGKTGENISKFFDRGRPIFIEGILDLDQWEAQDGTKRHKHYIIVNNFQFVDSEKKPEAEPQKPEPTGGEKLPF